MRGGARSGGEGREDIHFLTPDTPPFLRYPPRKGREGERGRQTQEGRRKKSEGNVAGRCFPSHIKTEAGLDCVDGWGKEEEEEVGDAGRGGRKRKKDCGLA